ncbi:hypothetical protein D3C86_2182600 [compost metagenome]
MFSALYSSSTAASIAAGSSDWLSSSNPCWQAERKFCVSSVLDSGVFWLAITVRMRFW